MGRGLFALLVVCEVCVFSSFFFFLSLGVYHIYVQRGWVLCVKVRCAGDDSTVI